MMRQPQNFPPTCSDGYQTVEVPCPGGNISLVIVLPDKAVLKVAVTVASLTD